jgi:hypothetical protein
MKAPMYPDAENSAVARPTTNSTPAAPRFAVMLSIGPVSVEAAVPGLNSVTMSVSARVVATGSATRPMIDTSASSAGKRDRSA